MDFSEIEERLLALNFRLVFLHRSVESFEQAREERLKISGNPKQYDDLSLFVDEQERIRELVESSKLTSLSLDISKLDVHGVADAITRWMVKTGGLFLD
jgi:hypothetical protein